MSIEKEIVLPENIPEQCATEWWAGHEAGVNYQRDEAREQVRVLRKCIDDWLQYEADSSDCPDCEACANYRPPDACVFKNAAFFLAATKPKP